MDASELWKRYRQYFCRVDSLDLSLDISRMHFDEAFLVSMEPAMQKAFKEMDALESGAIANPDEKRMVGHYWLRSPQLAPTKDIAQEITGTVDSIQKFAAGVHAGKIKPPMAERFTQVLAIGIGGSALGPMFVGDATRPVSLEAVLERLRLADAFVAVALDVGDQGIDPLQDLTVLLLPPDVVLPGGLVPYQLHSRMSRSTPPPCSSRSIEASSRRAFSGLRSR